MTVYVYRLYAADGTLLYVGQSQYPETRRKKHSTKWWGSLIDRMELDPYPTREEARAAERHQIIDLAPAHNRQHTGYTAHTVPARLCKCQKCRTRKTASVLRRRRAKLGTVPDQHGTLTAYFYHGCRCDPCREAKNANDRQRYHRLRSAA